MSAPAGPRAGPQAGSDAEAPECPVGRAARLWPEALALCWQGATHSYAALDELVRACQAALTHRGVRAGDCVAVVADNSPALVALIHAAARQGVALALLNARLTQAELAPLVAAVQPALLLADAAGRARLPAASELEELTRPSTQATPRAPSWPLHPAAVHTLLFTSGTTGRPKAAQLTVGNHQASARAACALLGIDRTARFLCCLPLYHVGGLAIAVRCALAGAALLLQPRFDAAQAADALGEGGRATHASLVAATLARTLDARGARPFPPSLRAVLIGGGPVSAALLARARRAGVPVLQTYGLTESASQATCEAPRDADGTTAGPALPGTGLRVVDGEICLRGPTVMRGYLGEPPLGEAWFQTGDLGTLDAHGRLTVHARRTDLIISGGENVYPAEIEATLLEHPDVAEVAVLGVEDPVWGQSPLAAVALRGARSGDADDHTSLIAFCRARLAAFKTPRRIVFLAALPRNASGKLDRVSLRGLLGLG